MPPTAMHSPVTIRRMEIFHLDDWLVLRLTPAPFLQTVMVFNIVLNRRAAAAIITVTQWSLRSDSSRDVLGDLAQSNQARACRLGEITQMASFICNEKHGKLRLQYFSFV